MRRDGPRGKIECAVRAHRYLTRSGVKPFNRGNPPVKIRCNVRVNINWDSVYSGGNLLRADVPLKMCQKRLRGKTSSFEGE